MTKNNGQRFSEFSDFALPFTHGPGRTICDANGRFVCRIDRGEAELGYDRLTPVVANALAKKFADLLTEAVWSGKADDLNQISLRLVK